MRHIFFQIWVLAAMGCLCGCASIGVYNPATDRHEFIFIPTDVEVSLGENLHRDFQQKGILVNDGDQLRRVRRVGQRVARVSDRQDYEYHFDLIDEDQLNAFTTPGGWVYIYTGLLKQLNSDDQIAAVLAHEVGHCAAKHVLKKFQASVGYNLAGSILLSVFDQGSQTRQIARMSSDAAMKIVLSGYSRRDEHEADSLGLKYMDLAGYRPEGMLQVLELLERESKGSQIPVILRTHPCLGDRISSVREQIRVQRDTGSEEEF